jgi:enoyl-CoA hydratase
MGFETILYEKKDKVAWITLNRPEVLNAQNDTLRAELCKAVEIAKTDNDVSVVVITGAGDKAFSAGADISMFPTLTPADVLTSFKSERRAVQNVRELIKPVIAMVNGLALGGGCELAMACDIIVASEKAKFGLPELSVGVIPGGGGTQVLPRLVGEKKAKELIFTGDFISADQALKIGMINKVVPPEQLKEAVEEIIGKIMKKSTAILKLAKIAINKAFETPLPVGIESEKELFAMCFGTQDQKEGARAFLEKRKPDYTGK